MSVDKTELRISREEFALNLQANPVQRNEREGGVETKRPQKSKGGKPHSQRRRSSGQPYKDREPKGKQHRENIMTAMNAS